MPSEIDASLNRILLLLALLTTVVVMMWALRAPAHPNSDRYDYAARAQHFVTGRGLGPQLSYPLRFAVADVEALPPRNLSRAPLWPVALAPLERLGLGARAGVVLAGALALLTVLLLAKSAGTAFGGAAGGLAALSFATAFATGRGIHGGGPEIAMGFLLLCCWIWRPADQGRLAHLACGTLYGMLCLLHPAGVVFALLALCARTDRYQLGERRWLLLSTCAVALPWYVWTWAAGGFVQGQAELAKSLFDSGGLGPYRTLAPEPNLSVLAANFELLARTVASRLWDRALHLDSLLSWTAVLLGVWGMLQHPRIAWRDLLALAAAGIFVVSFGWEFRLWVPLLPIAAAWSGAGGAAMRSSIWALFIALGLGLGWWIPLGASPSPRFDYAELSRHIAAPDAKTIDSLREAADSNPVWTESAVLAFEAGLPAVFLPEHPAVLERMRALRPLADADILALGHGMRSPWTNAAQSAWDSLFARSDTLYVQHTGAVILRLPSRDEPTSAVSVVGPGHRLSAEDQPDTLVNVPTPPASRPGIQLHPTAWSALERMLEAANDEGVQLRVISGYRSFEYQTKLYERAIEIHGESQRWVAFPGESEHQLGSAADLADVAMQHVLEQSFGTTPEGRWVRDNAERFGFRITYTAETAAQLGIEPEPWHVRYLGNLEGNPTP